MGGDHGKQSQEINALQNRPEIGRGPFHPSKMTIPIQVQMMSEHALRMALGQLLRGGSWAERWEERREQIKAELRRRERGNEPSPAPVETPRMVEAERSGR